MTLRFLSTIAAVTMLSIGCSDGSDPIVTGPTSMSTDTSVSASTSGTQGGCRQPAAPTLLRVTDITGRSVELTWEPVPGGAHGYSVMVGTSPGGSNVLFTNASEPTIRFTAPDGRLYARVQAYTPCGNGPASGSISFFVP